MFEVTLQQTWKDIAAVPPAPPPSPCVWGPEAKGSYLKDYPASLPDGGQSQTLAAAQELCCKHNDCGGVTFQNGIYQLRASTNPVHDGIATASWPRKDFIPQGSGDLHRWFTHYGTRRYGSTDLNAVAAWQLLGSTVYAGKGGGGFGSAISSVPVLVSPPGPPGPALPQPTTPAAPKGYTRRHPTDGYWNPPPQVNPNTSVEQCAEICTRLKPPGWPGIKCLAFEVYLTSAKSGNCYTFTNLKGAFTVLSGYPLGSRTYLRTEHLEGNTSSYRDDSRSSTNTRGVVAAAPKMAPPMTIGEKAVAANLVECYPRPESPEGGPSSTEGSGTPPLHHGAGVGGSVFQQAWALLLKASPKLGPVASYRFDLVDVGRQVIASHFSTIFQQYHAAFQKGDIDVCALLEKQLLQILDDYDELLSTDTNFMLGRWQHWARGWADAGDEATQANLEYNARNQLTLWGPSGQINDYAKKEWGGLVRSYYKKRYQLLFTMATESLNKKFQWDQRRYTAELLTTVEEPWQTNTSTFPVEPEADVVSVSQQLFAKYGTVGALVY
jgi:hypothetical protein